MQKSFTVALSAMLVLVLSVGASAEIWWTHAYEADDIPQNETPSWTKLTGSGDNGDPLTVSGGIATGISGAGGQGKYLLNSGWDSSTQKSVAFRVRVLDESTAGGVNPRAFRIDFVIAGNSGLNFIELGFDESKVVERVNGAAVLANLDMHEFHTFYLHLDKVGGAATMYIDNDPTPINVPFSSNIDPTAAMAFFYGLGASTEHIELDFIRWTNTGLVPYDTLVPEPASLALMGLASLTLLRRGTRRAGRHA